VLKAMAMDPETRFQTAAEFRAALLGEVEVTAPPSVAAAPAAPRSLSDSYLPTLPQTDSDVGRSGALAKGQEGMSHRRPAVWIGVALLAVVLAVGGFLLWQSRSGSSEPEPRSLAAEEPGRPAAARVAPRVADRDGAAEHASRVRVKVTVRVKPGDARLELDGKRVAGNPFYMPRGNERHRLRITAPGHETRTLSVVPSETQVLVVTLPRIARIRHRSRVSARVSRFHRHRPVRRAAPRPMRRVIETTTNI